MNTYIQNRTVGGGNQQWPSKGPVAATLQEIDKCALFSTVGDKMNNNCLQLVRFQIEDNSA